MIACVDVHMESSMGDDADKHCVILLICSRNALDSPFFVLSMPVSCPLLLTHLYFVVLQETHAHVCG